jgi:hypothetical protein
MLTYRSAKRVALLLVLQCALAARWALKRDRAKRDRAVTPGQSRLAGLLPNLRRAGPGRPGGRWPGLMNSLLFAFASILFLSSALAADSRSVEMLYEFQGPTESVSVLSSLDFPDYGDQRHWHRAGTHFLAREAPFDGTFGVVYQSHRAVVVEVFLRFHIDYLHAIVYYPDGRTPRYFQKQNLGGEGIRIAFRERPSIRRGSLSGCSRASTGNGTCERQDGQVSPGPSLGPCMS